MASNPLADAARAVRDGALSLVRDGRGVRVEDYLTTLASATGEAVIVDAGLFDIENNALTPGSAVFGDVLNDHLSGDAVDVAEAPPTTVVGVLRDYLVPRVVRLDDFPSLSELYSRVAGTVGARAWGTVSTSVPDQNQPRVLPLQVAFELRPVVSAAMVALASERGPGRPGPHLVCAMALASAIEQTAGAIETPIGLRLSLEVAFGMAKMVPMPVHAMDEITRDR